MEFVYSDIGIEKLVFTGTSQCGVEGELPLPQGRRAADTAVLWTQGSVLVNKVTALDDETLVEGRVRLELLCRDMSAESGESLFSFSTAAPLRCTFETRGSAQGMKAEAEGSLMDIKIDQGGRLAFSANAVIDCRIFAPAVIHALEGARDGEGEFMHRDCIRRGMVEMGKSEESIRDTLRLRNIRNIVYSKGRVSVSSVKVAGDTAMTDGTLYVTLLAEDEEGRFAQTTFRIPVTVETELDERPEGDLEARLAVKSLDVFPVDGDTLALEAAVVAEIFDRREKTLHLVQDAYVPGTGLLPAVEEARVFSAHEPRRVIFKTAERMMLREDGSAPSAILFGEGSAAVTSSRIDAGEYCTEGIIRTGIVFEDEEGTVASRIFQLPFENNIPVKDAGSSSCRAEAKVLECACTLVGREVLCEFSVELTVSPSGEETLKYVSAMSGGSEERCRRAILLNYAGEGETLFEIGKRFDVPVKDLILPKGGGPVLKEGTPVICIGKAQ